MKILKVRLNGKEKSLQPCLFALQQRFAQACNHVAKIAIAEGSFSRIRLHHLAYRSTREAFPDLGSQLISNAIYAVSRSAKSKPQTGNTQGVHFDNFSPVFFDRHTLSIKDSTLSLLTLDGRIKFQISLNQEFINLFKTGPLKEVLLVREADDHFLWFCFKEHSLKRDNFIAVEQAA